MCIIIVTTLQYAAILTQPVRQRIPEGLAYFSPAAGIQQTSHEYPIIRMPLTTMLAGVPITFMIRRIPRSEIFCLIIPVISRQHAFSNRRSVRSLYPNTNTVLPMAPVCIMGELRNC